MHKKFEPFLFLFGLFFVAISVFLFFYDKRNKDEKEAKLHKCFKTEEISNDEVRKNQLQKEAEEAGYQAYMDYARGSLTLEEAYTNRGFVKDEDGKWIYGKLLVMKSDQNCDEIRPKVDSANHGDSDVKLCRSNEHHFVKLKHFTEGSECRCRKCGVVIKFNRGWPERIEAKEMAEFLSTYQGSTIDF